MADRGGEDFRQLRTALRGGSFSGSRLRTRSRLLCDLIENGSDESDDGRAAAAARTAFKRAALALDSLDDALDNLAPPAALGGLAVISPLAAANGAMRLAAKPQTDAGLAVSLALSDAAQALGAFVKVARAALGSDADPASG